MGLCVPLFRHCSSRLSFGKLHNSQRCLYFSDWFLQNAKMNWKQSFFFFFLLGCARNMVLLEKGNRITKASTQFIMYDRKPAGRFVCRSLCMTADRGRRHQSQSNIFHKKESHEILKYRHLFNTTVSNLNTLLL